MGLLDHYIPDPALSCPVCGRELHDWTGTDGPCGLMVWKQGVASPIDQPIDDDARFGESEFSSFRLPDNFVIRAACCDPRFLAEAPIWVGAAAEEGRDFLRLEHSSLSV